MFLFVLPLKRYETTELEAKKGGRVRCVGNSLKEIGDFSSNGFLQVRLNACLCLNVALLCSSLLICGFYVSGWWKVVFQHCCGRSCAFCQVKTLWDNFQILIIWRKKQLYRMGQYWQMGMWKALVLMPCVISLTTNRVKLLVILKVFPVETILWFCLNIGWCGQDPGWVCSSSTVVFSRGNLWDKDEFERDFIITFKGEWGNLLF